MKKTNFVQVIANDKLFVPKEDIPDLTDFKYRYQRHLYNEKGCARCPYLEDRHDPDNCDPCSNHVSYLKLWSKKTIEGKTYFGVPTGWPERLQRILGKKIKIVKDLRPEIPFKHPIRFTARLYNGELDEDGNARPNQVEVYETFMERKSGIIKVPPRGGKTVLACKIICDMGLRTLIVVNQHELGVQFYRTFMGYKTENRSPMTNIPHLRKKYGKKIIKIVEKPEDLKTGDILIVNYQKFLSKYGPERISQFLTDKFSLLVVDEVHRAGALEYSRFINKLNPKYKVALTATDRRKDSAHRIVYELMGPVTATANTSAMIPLIRYHKGPTRGGRPLKSWLGIMKWLVDSKEYRKQLIDLFFKLQEEGHKCILIPVDWKNHQKAIVDGINDEARRRRVKLKEKWPQVMAVAFNSTAARADILKAIERGEVPALVAIRSMIKEGIDFKIPTAMIMSIPMSAKLGIGAPMFLQLSTRVSTIVKGKKQPEVHILVPDMPIPKSMIIGLTKNEIMFRAKGKNPSYKIDKKTLKQINEILYDMDSNAKKAKPRW